MFQKIMIIGCPGSGKSTFARILQEITHLPLYYLDLMWHKPDKTTVSAEEFDRQLNDILCRDKWIIDGNYQRTLKARLKQCDTVFFLDYPLGVCLAGAKARIGTKRVDLPWVETELDEEFRKWIIDFPSRQVPEIYRILEEFQNDKDIVIFKSREEAARYLEQLEKGV